MHAHVFRLLLEQQSKLAAIAHLVLRQVYGGMQWGFRVQCRLYGQGLLRIKQLVGHARIAQKIQAVLGQVQIFGTAQQHHVTIGAVKFDALPSGGGMELFAAVKRQPLHAFTVGQVGRAAAGFEPGGHPRQVSPTGPTQTHRCVATHQVPQNLPWHAGRGPRRDVTGRNHACVGKTGFFAHAAAAFENRHRMALTGQFVGTAHAHNARANHSHLHEAALSQWVRGEMPGCVNIIGFCWSAGGDACGR